VNRTVRHAWSRLVVALATGVACGAGATASVPTAHAFDRSDDFSVAAESGGGGGRRFTGAPADGLTCVVCHRPGRSHPTLTITGLPRTFVPGTRYDLVLEWAESSDNAALALELATTDGHGAGELALLDDASLEARDRCAGGSTAAHLVADVADRRVVTLDSCGASRLRAQWTAPTTPGAVWMTAALVQGNSSGDPSGDGVAERSVLVAAEGFGTDVSVFGGGCSATAHGPGGASAGLVAATVATLGLRRRRRRHGRARHGR